MKLDKNGYRSKNRSAFATAMKVLTLIFGVGVVIAAVCAYALLAGCGSGSGDGESVYDENGRCVENCSSDECPGCGYIDGEGNCVTANCVNNGDILVMPPGDTCDHDGCYQPQKDYVAPPCKVPTDPEIKKMCMPQEALHGGCGSVNGESPRCYFGFMAGEPCDSDEFCQQVPCTAWPPEVCQGLPCQLVGKWFWASPSGGPVSCADFSNAKFYDNGDGYCRVDLYDNGGEIYYKPGDDHLQRPPSGPAEDAYYLSEDGSQLKTSPDDSDPYERAADQTWRTWCQ